MQTEPFLDPGADLGGGGRVVGGAADVSERSVVLQCELVHGVRVRLAKGAVGLEKEGIRGEGEGRRVE